MIVFLEGVCEGIESDRMFLNVHGVGYEVFVADAQSYQINQTYRIHTYVAYREDSQNLYGFLQREQRNFFQLLVEKVSGVGPKLAMGILGFFAITDLFNIIFSRDENLLSTCPGIGKKTAQRLILELHDVLKKMPLKEVPKKSSDVRQDAIEALVVLGYGRKQAENLIHTIPTTVQEVSVENLLKQAFKRQRARS